MVGAKNTIISSQSPPSIVTTAANTANILTTVFTYTVPRGSVVGVPNKTRVKDSVEPGALFVLDLNTAGAVRISGASIIHFGVRAPGAEFVQWLRAIPYSIWRELTQKDQLDENYQRQLVRATDLNVKDGIALGEQYQFVIAVQGPDVVSWANSFLQFVVKERN